MKRKLQCCISILSIVSLLFCNINITANDTDKFLFREIQELVSKETHKIALNDLYDVPYTVNRTNRETFWEDKIKIGAITADSTRLRNRKRNNI
ncbi:hypothetical protein FACS1894132_07010 [Clostridia bacterium]|nr:hypothetical protein FACS1894132_07010 [Clostridia bacterium]